MRRYFLLMALLWALLVTIFDFSYLGLYQYQGDTESYTNMIEYFATGHKPADQEMLARTNVRFLKPVYGIMGAALHPIFEPKLALWLMNIVFYFGCIALLFIILDKYLKLGSKYACLGAIWFASGYPLLKYGFGLLTDIGGYFFALLGIWFYLSTLEKEKNYKYLLLGVISGVGLACKETGGLSIIFIFLHTLLSIKQIGFKQAIKRWVLVGLPFALIAAGTQFLGYKLSGLSYADWIKLSESLFGAHFRTIKYFIGTQGAAFNALWLFVLAALINYKEIIKNKILISLVVMTLPILAWPIFITRILYFQFLYVIPLALMGLRDVMAYPKLKLPSWSFWPLAALPVLTSLLLFFSFGQGTAFH